jgi:hypothetical protein
MQRYWSGRYRMLRKSRLLKRVEVLRSLVDRAEPAAGRVSCTLPGGRDGNTVVRA